LTETTTLIITTTIRTIINATVVGTPVFISLPQAVTTTQTIVSSNLHIVCTSGTTNVNPAAGLESFNGRTFIRFNGVNLNQGDTCVFTLTATLTRT
jgi:type III secretory pathway component EscS